MYVKVTNNDFGSMSGSQMPLSAGQVVNWAEEIFPVEVVACQLVN